MRLSEYLQQERGRAAALARAIGVAPTYLYQLEVGLRAVSPARAVQIERVTCGAVTRRDLRPHDWRDIWPELAEQDNQDDVGITGAAQEAA